MIPVLYVPPGASALGSASDAHSVAPVARIPGRDDGAPSSPESATSSTGVCSEADSWAALDCFLAPLRTERLEAGDFAPADPSAGSADDVASPSPGVGTITSSPFVI